MQKDPLMEQLDWFFTSLHWTNVYPKTLVKPLGKPVSDHIPCVVNIETKIPRAKLFRFESFWLLHPGFMEVVQAVWLKLVQSVNAAIVLCHKFKILRHDLKIWSNNISRLSVAIENCNKTLADLDELENLRTLTTPEANFHKIIKDTFFDSWTIKNITGKSGAPFIGSSLVTRTRIFFKLLPQKGTRKITSQTSQPLKVLVWMTTLAWRLFSFKHTQRGLAPPISHK